MSSPVVISRASASVFRPGDEFHRRDPPAGVLSALLTQLSQPQEDVASDGLLLRGQLLQNRIRRLSNGARYPTGLGIARQGERTPPPPLPRLQQRMGQQGQSARLIGHIGYDGLNQSGFQD